MVLLRTVKAILEVASEGQVIYVAGGYYLVGPLEVARRVKIIGGWSDSFTARDPMVKSTIVRTSTTIASESMPRVLR